MRGVVDDTGRVVVPVMEVPRHLPVEAHPLGGGERVLDGLADELVTEPDVGGVAGQQAAVLRHREAVVTGTAEHLDGRPLDPVRDDGDGPHDLGVGRGELAEARHHRFLDAGRQPSRRGRDQLGDEERVPARRVEELGGVVSRTGGERGDRVFAQRRQRQLGDVRASGGPEQPAQRVGQADLLAPVRQDDDHRQLADPACELADHVERGVIGPVEILDHDDATALRADGREDP